MNLHVKIIKNLNSPSISLAVAAMRGVISLILAFTGLQGTYDTEPILAIGLILLAMAGLMKK